VIATGYRRTCACNARKDDGEAADVAKTVRIPPSRRCEEIKRVSPTVARCRLAVRLRIIGPRSADSRVPVFTFVVDGRSPMDVARALDEQGIAVRAGDMAALPLLKRFGASEAVGASAYVYSTLWDIDRLADVLHRVAK
jgi:selenocysteine lyase/cysteine desulfurase